MSKYTTSTTKGKLRCNSCQKVVSPKDGDWFVTPNAVGQQIFLCKICEVQKKNLYKRAHLSRT